MNSRELSLLDVGHKKGRMERKAETEIMAKISLQALHSCVKDLEEYTKALIAEALFGQAQVEIQLVIIFCHMFLKKKFF